MLEDDKTDNLWVDEDVSLAAKELGKRNPHLPETVLRLLVRAAMMGLKPTAKIEAVLQECARLSAHLRKPTWGIDGGGKGVLTGKVCG